VRFRDEVRGRCRTWLQLFLLPVMPFASEDEVTTEIVADLTRHTLLNAHTRGALVVDP